MYDGNERQVLLTDLVLRDHAFAKGAMDAAEIVLGHMSHGDDMAKAITERCAVVAVDLSRAMLPSAGKIARNDAIRLESTLETLKDYRRLLRDRNA